MLDWLAGGERRTKGIERIYEVAAEAIVERGLDRLSIEDIAVRAGCSRATIYRHAGGKRAIRDAVLARAITRITDSVRRAVDGLDGEPRIATAILSSLEAMRTDPVCVAFAGAGPAMRSINSSLLSSPQLGRTAAELTGVDSTEPIALEWIVRVVLALLYWPIPDPEDEAVLIKCYVAQAFSRAGASVGG